MTGVGTTEMTSGKRPALSGCLTLVLVLLLGSAAVFVSPEEVTSLAPRSDNALTLITCYPFGHNPRSPQRFVVLASPAGPSRSAEGSRLANRAQL